MTNEFKDILLKWVSNWTPTVSTKIYDTFVSEYTTNTSIFEDYDSNATIKCAKQIVSPNNTGVMWTILVLYSDTLHKGRFVILDEENNIITTLDKYESNTDIGCYYGIDLDDKGRLYGIEYLESESRVRFIILNNIAIPKGTTYYADIRKTYNVPTVNSHDPIKRTYATAEIVKCINASKYGIFIYYNKDGIGSEGNFYTFEIDVENGNTWKEAIIPSPLWKIQKPYINYDSNNLFTGKFVRYSSDVDTSMLVTVLTEDNNGINRVDNTINTATTNGLSALETSQLYWLDSNTIVVPFKDDNLNKLYLQKLDIINETTFTQLYKEDFYTNECQVLFTYANDYLYMYAVGRNYRTSEEDEFTEGYKQSIYHIFNPLFNSSPFENNIEEYLIQEQTTHALIPFWQEASYFIVQSQYNLYNYMIGSLNSGTLFNNVIQEVYNENNYNGDARISFDSLDGRQMVLKHNGIVIYARNVYDKSTTNNITNYSVLVPNYFLNTKSIDEVLLYSGNKNLMDDILTNIIKNEYEEVIFNIHNKLIITDLNDNENPIRLTNMEEYLSNAFITNKSVIGDRITKARITYDDNTTENITLTATQTGLKTTLSFSITPAKLINKIEYISQSGMTYVTINSPSVEIGSTYTITQDVRIGD